jgi:hypothetical protein
MLDLGADNDQPERTDGVRALSGSSSLVSASRCSARQIPDVILAVDVAGGGRGGSVEKQRQIAGVW